MTCVQVGTFEIYVWDQVPGHFATLRQRTKLFEEYGLQSRGPGIITTVAITPQGSEPVLVVSQHRELDPQSFPLSVLVVPETGLALIGAAHRLLAYDLRGPEKLWEDHVEFGFLEFGRHDDTIVMSGELTLTAYDLQGQERWSMFVEPPWDYAVQDGQITVDVMGRVQSFGLRCGPTDGASR